MSYRSWFESHAEKHRAIVEKLLKEGYCADMIVEYFDYENMVRMEPEFCPLYAEGKKCHDMEQLNCYLCACPNFRFDDNAEADESGKTRYSYCAIDSKEGGTIEHNGAIHQDCSKCTVPHHRAYIQKHFDTEWKVIMRDCPAKEA